MSRRTLLVAAAPLCLGGLMRAGSPAIAARIARRKRSPAFAAKRHRAARPANPYS